MHICTKLGLLRELRLRLYLSRISWQEMLQVIEQVAEYFRRLLRNFHVRMLETHRGSRLFKRY